MYSGRLSQSASKCAARTVPSHSSESLTGRNAGVRITQRESRKPVSTAITIAANTLSVRQTTASAARNISSYTKPHATYYAFLIRTPDFSRYKKKPAEADSFFHLITELPLPRPHAFPPRYDAYSRSRSE